MAKVCRKPAVETSSIRLFNLVNSQNHPTHVWDFWKWLIFKRDHKKVTWFFPLDPVTFYGQNVEQQKCLEQVTSSLSYNTCLQKFLFWSYLLNLETVEREGKKRQKIE